MKKINRKLIYHNISKGIIIEILGGYNEIY